MKTGIERIADERKRQIEKEGYTPEDDLGYDSGELNDAAIAYAQASAKQARGEDLGYVQGMIDGLPGVPWPWERAYWKPSADRIRNLEKAGALIAAEIDRIQTQRNLTT